MRSKSNFKAYQFNETELDPLLQQLNKKILTIIPGKPNVEKIKETLTGRTINGRDGGYFNRYWYWEIEEGDVKDVKIINLSFGSSTCR